MRALSVLGRLLHLLDHVLASGEIDESCRTQLLQAHLLLLVARVDGDHVQAHGFGILLGEGSEAATSTNDGDGLARLSTRLLQALVDGDTGAENGGDGSEVTLLGDAGNVGSLSDTVLLEGAIDGVAGEEGLGAEGLVGALAEVTSKAGAVDPLRACQ